MENVIENEIIELKESVFELKEKIDGLEKETKQSIDELRQEIREVKETLFVIEHEHGRKIDAIYDFLTMQNQNLQDKTENIHRLNKRIETNEIKIFDHEKRIEFLEQKKA